MDLREAEELATRLLGAHGLSAQGWRFEFDRAVRRFGHCDFKHQRITLSKRLTLLNSDEAVRNMLLHEIAHAKLPPGTGHSQVWRKLAISIGCDGHRLHSAVTEPAWIATCPSCGRQVRYHRRRNLACARCCRGVYDSRFKFTWQRVDRARR